MRGPLRRRHADARMLSGAARCSVLYPVARDASVPLPKLCRSIWEGDGAPPEDRSSPQNHIAQGRLAVASVAQGLRRQVLRGLPAVQRRALQRAEQTWQVLAYALAGPMALQRNCLTALLMQWRAPAQPSACVASW